MSSLPALMEGADIKQFISGFRAAGDKEQKRGETSQYSCKDGAISGLCDDIRLWQPGSRVSLQRSPQEPGLPRRVPSCAAHMVLLSRSGEKIP